MGLHGTIPCVDIKPALAEQLHAGLAMLASCIERCPDDLWTAPNPPVDVRPADDNPEWNGVERPFWRIAFHTLYFTHLYLGQNEGAFRPPPPESAVARRPELERMWRAPWDLEPYELEPGIPACSRSDLLEYLGFLDGLIDRIVAELDLASSSSGFPWYPDTEKLSHQLLNLRHLQGHVGQLSELLMLRGIDIEWV